MSAIPTPPDTHGDTLTVCHAAGMVMAQLNVDIDEAQARLRSHASAAHRGVDEVAADIVSRRLRLDAPQPGAGPGTGAPAAATAPPSHF